MVYGLLCDQQAKFSNENFGLCGEDSDLNKIHHANGSFIPADKCYDSDALTLINLKGYGLSFNPASNKWIHFITIKNLTMKKFFALIVSLGVLTTVFAQSRDRSTSQNNHRSRMEQSGKYDPSFNKGSNGKDFNLADNGRGNRSYSNERGRYNSYAPDFRERDMQLQRVNQECDARMRQINNGYFRNGSDRIRQMRSIENERTARMREINGRYGQSQTQDHNYGRTR
jgi:hypothetical protein